MRRLNQALLLFFFTYFEQKPLVCVCPGHKKQSRLQALQGNPQRLWQILKIIP